VAQRSGVAALRLPVEISVTVSDLLRRVDRARCAVERRFLATAWTARETMIGGDFPGEERLSRGMAWAKEVARLAPAASLGSANVTRAPATPRLT